MRDITTLLKLENSEMSDEEIKYLAKYKQLKHFRHSTNFVYHKRKLPREEDVK